MNSTRRIVTYSILRLLMFVVPFTIFMLMSIEWWVSALLATVIAVCLSYIFLRQQRHELAETVESWRHGTNADADNELENAALDSAANDSAANDSVADDAAANNAVAQNAAESSSKTE